MQEEKTTSNSSIKKRRYSTAEIRQSHVVQWKQSGMSMSDYCRENDLALSSFSEWAKATQLIKQSPFKPVVVAPLPLNSIKQANLIEILVLDKLKIRFLDVTNATLVVDIAKELMRCS